VKKYGLTSGEKLYQRYCYYSYHINRVGCDSIKKAENKIKLLESIMTFLTEKAKLDDKKEIDMIKISSLTEGHPK